jgi:hypothetical protein
MIEEREIRSNLKAREVGLTLINKVKARQRARIKWLKLGVVNTNVSTPGQRIESRKTQIQGLHSDVGTTTSPAEIEEVIFNHMKIIGTNVPCSERFEWSHLGLPTPILCELDAPFTMGELKNVVFDTPVDKVLGPDDFSGGFFRTSWNVIKIDLLQALDKFHDLNDPSFDCLNTTYYVLLPKKEDP